MLTLPIKKKWFNLILSGEKTEEYRTHNDYYFTRFANLFGVFEYNNELLTMPEFAKDKRQKIQDKQEKCLLMHSQQPMTWIRWWNESKRFHLGRHQ